jgi:hypothetical protein
MGNINLVRVILGGLLAGLVINISEFILNTYVVADESAAIMERFGLPPIGANQIAVFIALTFVLGIVVVFVYAAMRPRFGAGTKTAIIAGVTIWLVAMFAGVADAVLGIIPAGLLVLTGIWSLVEMAVAAVAGAWLYQESPDSAARTATTRATT